MLQNLITLMLTAALNHTYWLSALVCLSFSGKLRAASWVIIPIGYELLHLLAGAWYRKPGLWFVASGTVLLLTIGFWRTVGGDFALSSLCYSMSEDSFSATEWLQVLVSACKTACVCVRVHVWVSERARTIVRERERRNQRLILPFWLPSLPVPYHSFLLPFWTTHLQLDWPGPLCTFNLQSFLLSSFVLPTQSAWQVRLSFLYQATSLLESQDLLYLLFVTKRFPIPPRPLSLSSPPCSSTSQREACWKKW